MSNADNIMNNSVPFIGVSHKSRATGADTSRRSVESQKLSSWPDDDMNTDVLVSHPVESDTSPSTQHWDPRNAASFGTLEDISQPAITTVIKDTPALPEDFNDRRFVFSQNARSPLPVRFTARAPSGQMSGLANLNQLIPEPLSGSSSGAGSDASYSLHSPGGISDASFISRTSSMSSAFTPISANSDYPSHLSSFQLGHIPEQQTKPEYVGRLTHSSSEGQYSDPGAYNPSYFSPPVQDYTGHYVTSPQSSVQLSHHPSYRSSHQRIPHHSHSFHHNQTTDATVPSVVGLGSSSNPGMQSYHHRFSSTSEQEGNQTDYSPSSSTSSLPSVETDSNSSQVSLGEIPSAQRLLQFVGELPPQKSDPTKKEYFCKLCNQPCGRKSDTYRHLKSGCKNAGSIFELHEFVCPDCNAPFKRQDALNRHIRKKACGKRRRRQSRRSPPPSADKGKKPSS